MTFGTFMYKYFLYICTLLVFTACSHISDEKHQTHQIDDAGITPPHTVSATSKEQDLLPVMKAGGKFGASDEAANFGIRHPEEN